MGWVESLGSEYTTLDLWDGGLSSWAGGYAVNSYEQSTHLIVSQPQQPAVSFKSMYHVNNLLQDSGMWEVE
jgi:hypothetical protein